MAPTRLLGATGKNGPYPGQIDGTLTRATSPTPGPVRSPWKDLDIIGGALEGLAKFNFNVPLCKKLVEHYCNGNGVDLGLTVDGMIACNAMMDFGDTARSPQFVGFINQMGAEIARNAGSDIQKLKTAKLESDISFDMVARCNVSGTLGNFHVNAWGKLIVWNPNADGSDADWSFDGKMWWSDLWDFDAGQKGRTGRGEWRTNMGSLLNGTPFEIKSASVPVHQARAEAHGDNHYAKWEGNPEGKPLPVISGIL